MREISTDGAQTVLVLFALLGLANLMLCMVATVVLVRYRTLVPLMFALFLILQVSRYFVFQLIPIVRTGAPLLFPK